MCAEFKFFSNADIIIKYRKHVKLFQVKRNCHVTAAADKLY